MVKNHQKWSKNGQKRPKIAKNAPKQVLKRRKRIFFVILRPGGTGGSVREKTREKMKEKAGFRPSRENSTKIVLFNMRRAAGSFGRIILPCAEA
ncbi:MAG TPA: hypothetical protein PLT67_09855 [Kiritimatiellia bacterium]|nr:hypothetical protein [Kiritimatiellia bacterium]